jgi:hypothetical protein
MEQIKSVLSIMGATVFRLFFWRRPFAIFRGIRAVVVDTVNCFSRRNLFHIIKKIWERFPSFANCDSASSVVFKFGAIGVLASFPHSYPNSIKSIIGFGKSVCGRLQSRVFFSPASTRLTPSMDKIQGHDSSQSSTITLAEVNRVTLFPICFCSEEVQDRPTFKLLLGQRFVFH